MFVILNISDSDKHWREWILEYSKRLGKAVVIENIKPIKNWTQAQIIEKETDLILERLEKKYKDTQYADIPDLFEELLKKQEIFFKISDAEIPENLDEDYFDFNCNYSTGIIFSKLTTK